MAEKRDRKFNNRDHRGGSRRDNRRGPTKRY